jgi:hypothetical protein
MQIRGVDLCDLPFLVVMGGDVFFFLVHAVKFLTLVTGISREFLLPLHLQSLRCGLCLLVCSVCVLVLPLHHALYVPVSVLWWHDMC